MLKNSQTAGEKKTAVYELFAICFYLRQTAQGSLDQQLPRVYLCVSVYWCFSLCVIWQHVYQSYATWTCHAIPHNVSMWALHFPPAPSDYFPTQSLDISYVSTNRRATNICTKQIYQEVFTYLMTAYKDLSAEVILEMFFIVFLLGKLLRDIVN